jgi:hypothetical protein
MQVPIVNNTNREVLLGLEPEGDTLPLGPGQKVVIKATGRGADDPQLEIDIDDDLFTISMMCSKEVWSDGVRIR